MKPSNSTIRDTILQLLEKRGEAKTICPSEVARELGGNDPEGWRPLMVAVRKVAATMANEHTLVITQRGRSVDIATAKGPVRLRLH